MTKNARTIKYSQAELQALIDKVSELDNVKKAHQEKIEAQRQANKRYLHKKRADELGISVEEYEARCCRRGRPKVYESNVIDLSKMEVEEVVISEPVEEETTIVLPSAKRRGRPKKN